MELADKRQEPKFPVMHKEEDRAVFFPGVSKVSVVV